MENSIIKKFDKHIKSLRYSKIDLQDFHKLLKLLEDMSKSDVIWITK